MAQKAARTRQVGPGRANGSGVKHIKDLVPDPQNRRQHNPRNLGMVVDALHQVGAARSIVIDEDNVVLAGNGVTEAAAEAGITKVQVVEADGSTLVAVRRVGLTPEQKRALAMYDNRTAELAEWNAEQLQADVDAGLSLEPWFSAEEQAKALGQAVKAGRTDPDAVPELRPTSIVAGDLFELGRHRLLCGDCTVADVAQLTGNRRADVCFTSPPYNAGAYTLTGNRSMVDKSSRYAGRPDSRSEDEYVTLLDAFTRLAIANCGGSGTTIIACEQLDRACYAIEIEPSYCQVIIDRWEQFTGQKAVKVGEAVPV